MALGPCKHNQLENIVNRFANSLDFAQYHGQQQVMEFEPAINLNKLFALVAYWP